MDAHRLAEERSLAYHAMVGERLRVDDAVVARARARIERQRLQRLAALY